VTDFPHNLYGDALASGTALTTDLTLQRTQMLSGWRRQRRQFGHNASSLRASWRLPTALAQDLVRWLEANNDWFMMRMISGNDFWQTCSVFRHEVRRTSEIACNRIDFLDQFTVTIDLETREQSRWEELLALAVGVGLQDYPPEFPLPRAAGFVATNNESGASTYSLSFVMNTATLRNWMAFAGVLGTTWFLMRMVSPSMPCGLEVMRFVSNPAQTLVAPDTWEVSIDAETMPPMFGVAGVSQPADVLPPSDNSCLYDEGITYDSPGHAYECVLSPEPSPEQYNRAELACLPMDSLTRMRDHVNGDWTPDQAALLMATGSEQVKFLPYALRIDYQGYPNGTNAPRYYNIVPTFRPSGFSVRGWVRSTSLAGGNARVILAARTISSAGSRILFTLSLVGSEIWAQLGNIFLYAPSGFAINTWHYVELSIDFAQTLRLFLDGQLLGSVDASQPDFVASAFAVELEIRPIQKSSVTIPGIMYLDDMAIDRSFNIDPYAPPTLPNCGGDPIPPPVSPPVVISGNAPDGTSGVAYSFAYALSGGVPPLTARVLSGALPPGIAILPSGELVGQSVAGVFPFVLEAIDSVGTVSAPLADSITFIAAPTPPGTPDPPVFNPGQPRPPTIEP
jgi:hypothetical protein